MCEAHQIETAIKASVPEKLLRERRVDLPGRETGRVLLFTPGGEEQAAGLQVFSAAAWRSLVSEQEPLGPGSFTRCC